MIVIISASIALAGLGLTAFGIFRLFLEIKLLNIVIAVPCIVIGLLIAFESLKTVFVLTIPSLATKMHIMFDRKITYYNQNKTKLNEISQPSFELKNTSESSCDVEEFRILLRPPYNKVGREKFNESIQAYEVHCNGKVIATFANQYEPNFEVIYWNGEIQGNPQKTLNELKGDLHGIKSVSALSEECIIFAFKNKIYFLNLKTAKIEKQDIGGFNYLYIPDIPHLQSPYAVFGVTEKDFIITFGSKSVPYKAYDSSIPGFTHFSLVSLKDLKVKNILKLSIKFGKLTGFTRKNGKLYLKTENILREKNPVPKYWSLDLSTSK